MHHCGRCLVVLEPVDRITTGCTLGPHGRIFTADSQLAEIFGYSESEVLGSHITELIPSVNLSSVDHNIPNTEFRTECLTGRTKSGFCFPLKLQLLPCYDEQSGYLLKYDIKIYILTTVSGIVTVLQSGTVHSCNENFTWALLGKTKDEILGQPVKSVITDIYKVKHDSIEEDGYNQEEAMADLKLSNYSDLVGNDIALSTRLTTPDIRNPTMTSTPADSLANREDEYRAIVEGTYTGQALHRDGSLINVGYQVRRLVLKNEKILYCFWIFYRGEFGTTAPSLRTQESTDSESDFDADILKDRVYPSSRRGSLLALQEMQRGEYDSHYNTLYQVGTGAFGAVRLASRKSDGLLVIAKFMEKKKVLPDAWVVSKSGKKVPIEIQLLTTLRHANIVEVIDVYENDLYYQMTMQKHGSGMDLFDFIDRRPLMEEAHMSYIFRQIVSAVSYLNSLMIVHRDLKDENVIIDGELACKLIDFGSAAYFNPQSVFSTFCGTMEYCAPEVLLGNKYVGPELEMWSLGILLYTLAYGENPFCTAEETIAAEFIPPWDVSEGLMHLIGWLLNPHPSERATVDQVSDHWWVKQKVDPAACVMSKLLPNLQPHELKPPKYLSDLSEWGQS